jgi:hypothetical protein
VVASSVVGASTHLAGSEMTAPCTVIANFITPGLGVLSLHRHLQARPHPGWSFIDRFGLCAAGAHLESHGQTRGSLQPLEQVAGARHLLEQVRERQRGLVEVDGLGQREVSPDLHWAGTVGCV